VFRYLQVENLGARCMLCSGLVMLRHAAWLQTSVGMTVATARPYLEEAEAEQQFPAELLSKEAVSLHCCLRF
jgi:hypothetical protein